MQEKDGRLYEEDLQRVGSQFSEPKSVDTHGAIVYVKKNMLNVGHHHHQHDAFDILIL